MVYLYTIGLFTALTGTVIRGYSATVVQCTETRIVESLDECTSTTTKYLVLEN